ncbi:MAG: hypothetical protein GY906_00640 [bacterium]|nr:hypothetical protein [bacterium]
MGSMRKLFVLVGILLVGVSVFAASSDKALAKDGTLYTTRSYSNMFALRTTSPDGTSAISPVPNTAGIDVLNPVVQVDDTTGAVVLAWLERFEAGFSQLTMAIRTDDEWFGPIVIAGDATEIAQNPSLLLHRAKTEHTDGSVVETTTIHLTWWIADDENHGQYAMYCSIPLNDEGEPELDALQSMQLRGMIGVSVICGAPEAGSALTRPYLFIDAATGNPHVMFFEPDSCSMHILELKPEVEEFEDISIGATRRRLVVILGRQLDIGVPVNVPPGRVDFSIGRGLTIVGYWDANDGIDFLHMDESGWSETRHVPLGEDINHEQAVTLIQRLAR